MITAAALCLVLLIAPSALSQDSFKCPHEYGFYPHPRSCDKYFKCENSVPSLKTCGNGLGFDSSDPKQLTENCDYLHNVDCGDRSELEPPIGSANCPRLYGIFPDEQRCDTFWSCWNGESNKYNCAPGLAYDRDARVCMWADQVPECKVTETDGGFKCPNPLDNPTQGGTFSRHAHPEDCRKYYICLDGSPREYGCPIGTVFKIGDDSFSGQCTDPEGVEGCENYYGDDLKGIRKSELLLGLTGGNDGSYTASQSVTQRPTIRKKVPQRPVVEAAPQAAQSIQSGTRVQQQQQTRERVRPNSQQQQSQQQQQQQSSRKQQQEQQQARPQPTQSQQQSRPAPVTTSRPAPTTEAPKPAATKDDDYYYYDNYEDVPAQGQQQQPQKQQ